MHLSDPLYAHALRLIEAGRRGEAILLVNQRAAAGDPSAWLTLALWQWEGIIVPRAFVQARALFERAGKAGHRAGRACSTNLLANGVAGPRDWKEALKRLREEARHDPPRQAASKLLAAMRLTPEGDPAKNVRGQALSTAPEVHLLPRLFSPAECDYLVRVAEPNLRPSFVVNPDTGLPQRDPTRTSDAYELQWCVEDPAIHALNRRLAAATGTAVDQGEPLQILRYGVGQEYRRHIDAVPGLENQRVLTALVYLNEGYEGGELFFPRTGLKVKGRKGDMILFRNASATGVPDLMSQHAGLPVSRGTKLLASRWIHLDSIVP
jgi:prolyl 4-hydroxylase